MSLPVRTTVTRTLLQHPDDLLIIWAQCTIAQLWLRLLLEPQQAFSWHSCDRHSSVYTPGCRNCMGKTSLYCPPKATKEELARPDLPWASLSDLCVILDRPHVWCKEHTHMLQEPGYFQLRLPRSPSFAEEELLELGLVTHREAGIRCSSTAKSSLKSCTAPKGQNYFLQSSFITKCGKKRILYIVLTK